MNTIIPNRASVPSSVQAEHRELHHQLEKAEKAGGKIAEAAREVHAALRPHFLAEEEFVMPELGVLKAVAGGKAVEDAASIIAMSEKLEAELPKMLEEHRQITAALEKLQQAAMAEGKTEHAAFAEKLKLHARNEEEILYPASILVGKFLKQQKL